MKKRICALALALLCLTGCGGGGGAKSLTEAVEAGQPEVRPMTGEDASALAEFSAELLRANWTGENILLSPLSVLCALGMAANGAKGETLAQMESVLGLPVEELNNALAAWTEGLPKEKDCRMGLANAVWFRDDGSFRANEEFLKIAAGWYGAEAFGSKFDEAAVREINRWVQKNTDGMIGEIIDEFSDDAVMCLVNALALEAEWAEAYEKYQVREGRIFTTEDGQEQPVTLMYNNEGWYLRDEGAQGFLKPYKGGRWAFAALLPDEGKALEGYVSSLTGERLQTLLENAERTVVETAVPKFKSEYAVELSESLKAMGMPDAFEMELADLSGLGSSDMRPLFISRVLHKACIEVDEKGTKAGAATVVEAVSGSAGPGGGDPPPRVILDRPFLYMLVDTETNLPAFIGAVASVE